MVDGAVHFHADSFVRHDLLLVVSAVAGSGTTKVVASELSWLLSISQQMWLSVIGRDAMTHLPHSLSLLMGMETGYNRRHGWFCSRQ